MTAQLTAPLLEMPRLGSSLGVTLAVQRDDLLPFPLASSKVRALRAELHNAVEENSIILTNGDLDSNHCRTLAFLGAEHGFKTHLILHGDETSLRAHRALAIYHSLGASTEIVRPAEIATQISAKVELYRGQGLKPKVVQGGCHTPKAAIAYRDAAIQVFAEWNPDLVFVASGTGAIQGGLIAASRQLGDASRVIGVSVARSLERGAPPVQQAAAWAGAPEGGLQFDDRFTDGGYGRSGQETKRAVALGWSHGLPLDLTYTGKAFRALLHYAAEAKTRELRVLFWHTGGLWNYVQTLDAT